MPLVLGLLREELASGLADERLRPGVDLGEAADFVARIMLSHVGTPGCWRLDDPAEAGQLVRHQRLAGVLEPAGSQSP
jgi:hypothetical protein